MFHCTISIHALREEGDLRPVCHRSDAAGFLSTPSARRATEQFKAMEERGIISIHALREEGDNQNSLDRVRTVPFLSTPSARRATGRLIYFDFQTGNFYPRPPRGGRRELHGVHSAQRIFLSTPSARRATIFFIRHLLVGIYFYPRPPRGGRRKTTGAPGRSRAFLSTPSARRATLTLTERNRAGIISIHALREEGDLTDDAIEWIADISIHALREEGDGHLQICPAGLSNFYPRPPRGGRPDR